MPRLQGVAGAAPQSHVRRDFYQDGENYDFKLTVSIFQPVICNYPMNLSVINGILMEIGMMLFPMKWESYVEPSIVHKITVLTYMVFTNLPGRHLGCWSFGLPFADWRFLEALPPKKMSSQGGGVVDPPFFAVENAWNFA